MTKQTMLQVMKTFHQAFQCKQALSTQSRDLNTVALFSADLERALHLKCFADFAECRNSSFTRNQSYLLYLS